MSEMYAMQAEAIGRALQQPTAEELERREREYTREVKRRARRLESVFDKWRAKYDPGHVVPIHEAVAAFRTWCELARFG